jgi:predicted RNA-binding Zn-ribbon protein involved in translation (DUF1610 family)
MDFTRVDPAYTSQDCSQCGHTLRKTLSMREHRCDKCGFVAHRDHNSVSAVKGLAGPSGMAPLCIVTVYAVSTSIGMEMWTSAICFVFEKNFSRIPRNYIDIYILRGSMDILYTNSLLNH